MLPSFTDLHCKLYMRYLLVVWHRSSHERSYPTSGPVSTWMGDHLWAGITWAGIPSPYTTSQLGQLSLASLRGQSLNRVPASAGVKAGMSPLPGGR